MAGPAPVASTTELLELREEIAKRREELKSLQIYIVRIDRAIMEHIWSNRGRDPRACLSIIQLETGEILDSHWAHHRRQAANEIVGHLYEWLEVLELMAAHAQGDRSAEKLLHFARIIGRYGSATYLGHAPHSILARRVQMLEDFQRSLIVVEEAAIEAMPELEEMPEWLDRVLWLAEIREDLAVQAIGAEELELRQLRAGQVDGDRRGRAPRPAEIRSRGPPKKFSEFRLIHLT
jgi:hypothetical protein